MSPSPPEAGGEFVREEQSKVTAFLGQETDGRLSTGPDCANMGLKPAAELESVKLSLIQQQTQQLFSIHCTNPCQKRKKRGLNGDL
jgi:hypothetical protein